MPESSAGESSHADVDAESSAGKSVVQSVRPEPVAAHQSDACVVVDEPADKKSVMLQKLEEIIERGADFPTSGAISQKFRRHANESAEWIKLKKLKGKAAKDQHVQVENKMAMITKKFVNLTGLKSPVVSSYHPPLEQLFPKHSLIEHSTGSRVWDGHESIPTESSSRGAKSYQRILTSS